uniref:Uncharacterized protein n=1 Tax=Anopheles culicifacies TaxID=139723 RepID=A0A182M0E0_9DIPT
MTNLAGGREVPGKDMEHSRELKRWEQSSPLGRRPRYTAIVCWQASANIGRLLETASGDVSFTWQRLPFRRQTFIFIRLSLGGGSSVAFIICSNHQPKTILQ